MEPGRAPTSLKAPMSIDGPSDNPLAAENAGLRTLLVQAGIDNFPGFLGDLVDHLGGVVPVKAHA